MTRRVGFAVFVCSADEFLEDSQAGGAAEGFAFGVPHDAEGPGVAGEAAGFDFGLFFVGPRDGFDEIAIAWLPLTEIADERVIHLIGRESGQQRQPRSGMQLLRQRGNSRFHPTPA